MATTITKGDVTVTPALVLGYDAARMSRNLVHNLIGNGAPNVTLKPASLRSGTLELLFADESTAAACEALHATEGSFTLTDSDRPSIGMVYVVGSIRRQLEPETRAFWIVSVGFQEVSEF